MKKELIRMTALALLGAVVFPAVSNAQDVSVEGHATQGNKRRSSDEQIIITRKADSTGKLLIEVDGDNIKVNGKPIDDENADVSVSRRRLRDRSGFYTPAPAESYFNWTGNTAVLGVTTEREDEGVSIQSVSKNSAAEKAGLKEDDIITKIDETKIETPDQLSKAIRRHKPGDKVTVTFIRNKKTDKVTAELKESGTSNIVVEGFPSLNFNADVNSSLAELQHIPRVYGNAINFGGAPRLGLMVQDPEDGKGVKVLDVDDESNADKAGLEDDDIILEVDGKAVNSADELAKIMKDSKDKATVKFKYERGGKTNSTDVRIPRKLKTANL